jgi:hypothetical protein
MKAIINEKGRAVKVYESDEERKAAQNQQYASWRAKLEGEKLAEYRRRKNEASKKCIAKRKAEIEALKLQLAELQNDNH